MILWNTSFNTNIFIKLFNCFKYSKNNNCRKYRNLGTNNIILSFLWNFIIIYLVNSIKSERLYNENRKLSSIQSIHLKIADGYNTIMMNKNFCPDRIIINGANKEFVKDVCILNIDTTFQTNNVAFEWDKKFEKMTDLSEMFKYIKNIIIGIDFTNFDTTGITSTAYMFSGWTKLQYIIFTNFNTSSVIDMSYMFEICSSLESIDLSYFDTSNVITMEKMFTGCSSLTSLNLASLKPKI